MKKLLTIALLVVSPMLFAKDFSPDFLLGSWQCRGAFSYPYSYGTETYTDTYHADGTNESKNLIKETIDGQKNTVTIHSKGRWRMTGDVLSSNLDTLIYYHASNKEIAQRTNDEEEIRNDNSFYDVKVIELTKNKLVFMQTEEDEREYKMRYKYACHRVK